MNIHGQILNNTDLVLVKWLVINAHSVFKYSTTRISIRVKTKFHTCNLNENYDWAIVNKETTN